MRNINDNAVQGRLFPYNLWFVRNFYRTKYFGHEIFAIYGKSSFLYIYHTIKLF